MKSTSFCEAMSIYEIDSNSHRLPWEWNLFLNIAVNGSHVQWQNNQGHWALISRKIFVNLVRLSQFLLSPERKDFFLLSKVNLTQSRQSSEIDLDTLFISIFHTLDRRYPTVFTRFEPSFYQQCQPFCSIIYHDSFLLFFVFHLGHLSFT